ncbi:hypothetical protein CSKR_113225 [Clonorchis sinensis]|uniref:Uncharacterized protein n=1 Tax=Clonorchis sinensis TaxID=79923 RepID=A0A419PXA6_CLOSI|nr:hypothetical protein CSKR_113225 [Clonorchis sinensis]
MFQSARYSRYRDLFDGHNTLLMRSKSFQLPYEQCISSKPEICFTNLLIFYSSAPLAQSGHPTKYCYAPFQCLTTMPPEDCMKAEILPGRPSLDRGSREAEVGIIPRSLHLQTLIQAIWIETDNKRRMLTLSGAQHISLLCPSIECAE